MSVTTGNQPNTEDRSEREGVIRDLYALAAFYVAHPDHPLPTSIAVHHYVPTRDVVEAVVAQFPHPLWPGAKERSDGAVQGDHFLNNTNTDIVMHVVWKGDAS
jgi:hypothetical protein